MDCEIMGLNDKYRRVSDEPARLLIVLDERVTALQKIVEKLVDKQIGIPCQINSLKIRYLERIIFGVVAAVALLSLKALFNYFV